MKVIITPAAEADLERIADYIAQDNPLRAVTFVEELVQRCRWLADSPQAFPVLRGYEQFGIRRRPHGQYLIFYIVGAGQIDILHILNGAQDYESLLFFEGE